MISRRQILVLTPLAGLLPTLAQASNEPDEGIDYDMLDSPVPTAQAHGIEVIEFFRYGCPFCNRMEPLLQAWKQRLPSDVVLRLVPVSFQSTVHQQLYITLAHLGVAERLHTQVFHAIHQQGLALEMLYDVSEWGRTHDLSVDRLEAAWHSPAVAAGMDKANALVQAYGVTSVPQFGVNGRYRTSPAMVGGSNARALEVVDHLIQRSRG